MRIRIFHTCFVLIWAATAYAQNNGVVVGGKWANQIFVTDVNGRPFENKYEDVSGSPYFSDTYKYANIKLAQGQGRTFVNVRTRIDLAAQETYFVSSNGVEAVIEAGMVKEITYADTTADGIMLYKFQTGFPAVDMKTANHFYQVLAEGRCSFLKSIVKKVTERKNELSGEKIKDFETYENYYLFRNGEMKRLKKDKDFLLAELADKQAQVAQYMQANKLSVKNSDHLVKLFEYYNTL
ncbi:MAG: hypothetical protein JWQ78_744 [Sediminibacterium sp.]|nr:hypothetical protein [Sediminibacterium sp.]